MAVIDEQGQHARARPDGRGRDGGGDSRPRKALTIGAVAKILGQEFDDISISKIRYLEDQKLLAPRRTAGRLPPLQPGRRRAPAGDPAHAARRVPAPAGDPPGARHRRLHRPPRRAARARSGAPRRSARPVTRLRPRGAARPRPGVGEQFLRELQEFGIVAAKRRDGRDGLRRDRPRDRPRRGRAVPVRRRRAQPARLPDLGRPRGGAARAAARAPQLRSRSQARRKEAVENLESLAAVCGHLKHLLLVRDLRRLKSAAE